MINASIVLEGGAARGVFTAGALDYLMEQDIYCSHVVGVSAGSCNGVDYISGQIGRTKNCMIHKDKENAYIGVRTLIRRRTLYDMDMVFDYYPNVLYPFDFDTYSKSYMRGEWVVTNCRTGEAEYLDSRTDKEELMKIIRASSSMPVVSPMVELHGEKYLDGGLADSIPIERALSYGNDKVIVILTRKEGYRKKPIGKMQRDVYQRYFRDYPQLIETICTRAENYNRSLDQLVELEREGKVFVIHPFFPTVGRTETRYERLLEFYQHGYQVMKNSRRRLEAYLMS